VKRAWRVKSLLRTLVHGVEVTVKVIWQGRHTDLQSKKYWVHLTCYSMANRSVCIFLLLIWF
jgi:lambda repressor-like predicted transcriptional regulator